MRSFFIILRLTAAVRCGSVPFSGLRRRLYVYFTAMSTELPQKAEYRHHTGRITVVASRYNEKYTDALLENCIEELAQCAPGIKVEVVRVPGAFEVPVMVKRSILKPASGEAPAAVIALGVILRGSTAHADLIGTAITTQLLSISCETMVPVVHEVLLLDNEEQAFARCIASALNRGREAARAAMSMLSAMDAQSDKRLSYRF